MIIHLEIQGLPKRTNSSPSSWKAKMVEARKWKRQVTEAVMLMSPGERPIEPLDKAKLTLIRHSSARPDSDGLVSSFKHVIDGLIVAKIITDDNFNVIGMPDYQWQQAPRKYGFIEIIVESA